VFKFIYIETVITTRLTWSLYHVSTRV